MKTRWMIIVGVVGLCSLAQAVPVMVTIGDAGNTADGNTYGDVGYNYDIAKYETTIAEWDTFYNDAGSGKIGVTTVTSSVFQADYNHWNTGGNTVGPNAPVVRISRDHAAQYCNWLTTGSATNGAYTINSDGAVTAVNRSFRNELGKLYVLPTVDEWYKAAYYTGESADYWSLYANGTDLAPGIGTDSRYLGSAPTPWSVGSGTVEQNATYDMMGNVTEWLEPVIGETQARAGGWYTCILSSQVNANGYLLTSLTLVDRRYGFRVAMIPEPTSILMISLGGLLIAGYRRFFGFIS